jgi:hypothetical protein
LTKNATLDYSFYAVAFIVAVRCEKPEEIESIGAFNALFYACYFLVGVIWGASAHRFSLYTVFSTLFTSAAYV